MKKILLTGGGGHIGTVLTHELLHKGYFVKVLDNFMYGDYLEDNINLEKVIGDIRNKNLVDQAIEDTDCVIHLACISNDPCSELNPVTTREINFDASEYLIKAAKKTGVSRFIFASSSSVYGIKDEPEVTEDLQLEPITLYSELKCDIEKVLFDHGGENFTTVAVRSATVCGYSPRMRLDTILNIFVNCAINKGKISIEGGEQMRALIHIKDNVRFYSMLIDQEKTKIDQQAFNIGSGNYTVKEVAEIVKSKINCIIEKVGVTDPRSYTLSTKKAFSILGFEPKYSLYEAMDEVRVAFEQGLIDPDDIRLYNIKLMKSKNFF